VAADAPNWFPIAVAAQAGEDYGDFWPF